MASRLRRTWNRLIRRHPDRKLLTPQPSEIKGFFPGRDSLAIRARDEQRRRPVTAMARYGTPETPVGERSIAFIHQPSPASYVSDGISQSPTRQLVFNAAHHDLETGSPSRTRRSNVPSLDTPIGSRPGVMRPCSTEAASSSPCIPVGASNDVGADSESERSVALTSATSSMTGTSLPSDSATPTTSPVQVERKSPSIFVDEKIPVLSEPAAEPERCPSPLMQATSGPLQDYYVYYNA